jgi:hypothetical protein
MTTNWLDQSIMHTRGLGRERSIVTHELTEAKQGTFHFTIGPYSNAVMTVKPGDRIVVETRDAFDGKVKTEQDLPSKVLTMPFVNPQNGPIMVEGAEPGDTLAVHIESMAPRGPNPRGTCCMIPQFGALSGTAFTALLGDSLPEITRKIDVDEEGVYWSKRVTLPYRPHIGTLSCSPEIDSINSLTPDQHGGNMDLPDMGPGSITYLPVRTAGRAPVHRRRARLPGRRRGVRHCGGVPEPHDDSRGPREGLDARMAAAGNGRDDHGHRQRASAGRRDPHRLQGAGAVDGGRVRLRPLGRLHDAQPVRQGAPGQLRGPEVHGGRGDLEDLPGALTLPGRCQLR